MIHKLIDVLSSGARELGARCVCADIEKMAIMVHRIMSYQSRRFHTLEHVFGFLEGADALTSFAAVFHDLVYYQVDDGLPPEVEALLGSSVSRLGGEFHLKPEPPAGDPGFRLCCAVFGLDPGQKIGLGLNEFLSTLAMIKLLESHLQSYDLVAIAVCIEASIPFRGPDEAGRGIGERLEARLLKLRDSGALELSNEGARALVHRAIAFANADVRDFSAEDPAQFLSNTWKLLPESNASLRSRGTFNIGEYRHALENMRGFFRLLDPEAIYHAYLGQPDGETMLGLAEAARRNLSYAGAYMRAKLLAVGLLEAAAEVSGGDAPMALFMGDAPAAGESEESLVNHLPDFPAPPWIDTKNAVYRLLKDGRLDESSFDLRNSPLALYLYHRLKPGEWKARSEAADAYFAGKIDAEAFLAGFDPAFQASFLGACAAMVPTRSEAIKAWLQKAT